MAAYNSAAVTNVIQGIAAGKHDLLYTLRKVSEEFDGQFDLVRDAAAYAEQLEDKEQVKALRDTLVKLLDAQAVLQWRLRALEGLRHSYQCTEATTDFEAKLLPPKQVPPIADREQRLREFDRAVWNVHHSGKPMPDEEDQELWVDPTQQSLAPNDKCPLTLKELLSIAEPVKDNRGFVYEREAVLVHIGKSKDHNGYANCPAPGATHTICAAELKEATHILRAKKKKQHRPTQAHEDEDVISL